MESRDIDSYINGVKLKIRDENWALDLIVYVTDEELATLPQHYIENGLPMTKTCKIGCILDLLTVYFPRRYIETKWCDTGNWIVFNQTVYLGNNINNELIWKKG